MFKKNFDEGENKSSWFCEKYSRETKQESLLMGVLYSLKIRNGEDVVKAIEVTEEEIDEEVSRAVRSSARPGRVHKVK